MANGGIPTGGAPLFLGDFSKTAAAIGQRTTEMLSQRLKEKRQQDYREHERTQQRLLEAMDFSAVEGLGRKAAMEHAKELNDFNQRWMKTYYDRGNKLSTADLVKLNQEKTQLDQKIANMKHNVSQYAKYQQMVKEKPHLWHPKTLENLLKYKEEGNLGMDASHIMIPFFNVFDYAKDRMDFDEFEEIGAPKIDEKGQFYTITESNLPSIQRQIGALLQDPVIASKLEDPQERGSILAQLQTIGRTHARQVPKTRPVTSTMIKGQVQKNLLDKYKTNKRKSAWAQAGLDEKYYGNMDFMIDFSGRFIHGDQEAFDLAEDNPDVNRVDYLPDGVIDIIFNKRDNDGNPIVKTIEPKDWDNPEKLKSQIAYIWQHVAPPQLKAGKTIPENFMDYLNAIDDPEIKVEQPAEITGLANLRDVLSRGNQMTDNEEKSMFNDLKYFLGEDAVGDLPWYTQGTVKKGERKYSKKKPEDMQALYNMVTDKLGLPRQSIFGDSLDDQAAMVVQRNKSYQEALSKFEQRFPGSASDTLRSMGITPENWNRLRNAYKDE